MSAPEAAVAPKVNPRRLVFARGFFARGFPISTAGEPRGPARHLRRELNGWGIWHDRPAGPRGRHALGPDPAALGDPVPRHDRGRRAPGGRPRGAFDRLAAAPRRSEEAFLAALDTMAGRHAVLYEPGGHTHVVADAAGTRQVLHHRGEATQVAPHAKLPAENAGAEPQAPRFRFGHPGLDTAFHGVHILVPKRLREMSVPRDLTCALGRNAIRPHVGALAWALLSEFPRGDPWLHVRSDVSEVGRQFQGTPTFSDPPRALDPAHIVLARWEEVRPREVFDAIERFERYARITGIFDCADKVDLASLLCREHRMPAWPGDALVEADVGMDTAVPYNCRKVLELLPSVPLGDRQRSAVHRHLIAEQAPELTRLPVIGKQPWT